jgi:hypothetical protein
MNILYECFKRHIYECHVCRVFDMLEPSQVNTVIVAISTTEMEKQQIVGPNVEGIRQRDVVDTWL